MAIALLAGGCVMSKKTQLPSPVEEASSSLAPLPNISFEEMSKMEGQHTGSYQLGSGDTVTVSVYGEEALTRTVTIEPNGSFTFPLIGEVKAQDRTVSEVVKDMDERLGKYLAVAKTDIIINEFSSNQITILGEGFINPGTYTLTGDVRLLEAIALAGGLRTIQINMVELPGADLTRAYLARGENILPVNFEKLLLHGNMKFNIRLRPKDVIFVPLMTSREVFVMGAVKSPSAVPVAGVMTLVKAVALSGGFASTAKITKVKVVRNSMGEREVFKVDMKRILNGRAPDFILEPGDIVYVEESVL